MAKEVPSGKLAESYPFAYADCSMFNYADEKYRNLPVIGILKKEVYSS